MKHVLLTVGLVSWCLVGCVPESTSPLHSGDDDLVVDDRLIGVWRPSAEDGAGDMVEDQSLSMRVRRDGESRAYRLEPASPPEGEESKHLELRLVRLGDRLFMSLGPSEEEGTYAPGRIWIEEGELRVAMINYTALMKLLQDEPEVVAHEIGEPGPYGLKTIQLTADTPALRAFVEDRLDDETYFADAVLMKLKKVEE